jgi:lysophospholipase L1-like esterase
MGKTPITLLGALLLSFSTAAAVSIDTPKLNTQITNSQALVEVNGACRLNREAIKVEGIDRKNKSTGLVWIMCQGTGWYATHIDISKLAAGKITVKAIQTVNRRLQTSVSSFVKLAVTPAPSPSPTVAPSPSPTVVPSPSPSPVPTNQNITMGVVGHDGISTYPLTATESIMKVLDANNLRSYRSGGDLLNNLPQFDAFLAMAKKYNITIRPVIYPTTQAKAYAIAKRYANDIKIWEVGNELDGAEDQAGAIASMVETYKGIKQASDELKAGLKTTINVMACNNDYVGGRCDGQAGGSLYFIDAAKAAGFNFDYISFHYYPFYGDTGYWMDKYLGQMRMQATKYKTKVFYNEVNCAEIYQGNTTGGYAGDKGCYDSLKNILTVLNRDYKDIVAEINVYELLDEPAHPVTHEKHFGLMYDLNTPKEFFKVVTSFSKNAAPAFVPGGSSPVVIPPVTTPSVPTLKIMPLGDSLTDGYTLPGGYRDLLEDLFIANFPGFDVDFVGSQSGGPASLADKNHEGHNGWRIDQIDANVSSWAAAYQPEFVLLDIGANDLLQNYQLSMAPSRVMAVIDKLRAQNPNMMILVGTVIPVNVGAALDANIKSFNASLSTLVKARTSQGQRVYLVDMYTGMSPTENSDGIHPTKKGYDEMARRWLQGFTIND